MKILEIFPGKVWGGAEQYILDMSHALKEQGHEVSFIANDVPVISRRLENEPFDITLIPTGLMSRRPAINKIAEVMRQGFDIVHIHELKHARRILAAARRSGTTPRIVATRHIARASRTLPLFRQQINRIDKIIFVSQLAEDLWLSANRWFDTGKCAVILNSIPDTSKHQSHRTPSSPSLRQVHGISPSAPLLVFSGRVRKSKGAETIVEALAKIANKDCNVVFIGNCKPKDYNTKLKALTEQLGVADRVHFHGFTPDVRSLICDADIGLAPSIVKESCCLSAMEFMQTGKCVITSDNGAQREYITDGVNGCLIPPDDPDVLADTIDKLLSDSELLHKISSNAQTYFNTHLNYRDFIAKITATFGDMLHDTK